MEVEIRYFATLAERTGTRRETVRLPEGSVLGDVRRQVMERHPEVRELMDVVHLSRNEAYEGDDAPVTAGDTIALIPPVSGGSGESGSGATAAGAGSEDATLSCRVQEEPLDIEELSRAVDDETIGAVVTFSGTVRGITGERRTDHLVYEAYEEMAAATMREIAVEMRERWSGLRVAMVHRSGRVDVNEWTVMIAVGAPHRREAFAAARHGIDELKQRVPIWKKEVGPDGTYWVGLISEHCSDHGDHEHSEQAAE